MKIVLLFVMLDDNYIFLTKSILVHDLFKKQFNVLFDISLRFSDLRNCALDMTGLYKSRNGEHYKKIIFKSVISGVKKRFKDKEKNKQQIQGNTKQFPKPHSKIHH